TCDPQGTEAGHALRAPPVETAWSQATQPHTNLLPADRRQAGCLGTHRLGAGIREVDAATNLQETASTKRHAPTTEPVAAPIDAPERTQRRREARPAHR